MTTNYKQIFAIKAKNKKRLLEVNPRLNDGSGIYFLTRTDENGFRFGYIGQALHICDRLISHMSGYEQHIDLSLKKHGLYNVEKNPYGWKIGFLNCPESKLDELEQYWIKRYADEGYQLRNKTSGSQGEGKSALDYKPIKGYRQGVDAGYKKASKEVSHLFDLHLDVKTKSDKPNKNQEKALQKFLNFLNYHKEAE